MNCYWLTDYNVPDFPAEQNLIQLDKTMCILVVVCRNQERCIPTCALLRKRYFLYLVNFCADPVTCSLFHGIIESIK